MDDVRVLVVDDHEQFRRTLAALVGETPGFAVVGAVGTGEDSLAAARRLRPDLVLMDVTLPGISGVEATRRIRSAAGAPVVVLMSTYDEDEIDHERCGSAGFVAKAGLDPDRLREIWAAAWPADGGQAGGGQAGGGQA